MPTFDTPEPIHATIDIGPGKVRIDASDRADTVVELRPRDASRDADVQVAEQTIVEYTDGTLLVKAPKKARSWFGRSGAIDLSVSLPEGSRLNAKAASDFHCTGRLGSVRINSGFGEIKVDEAADLHLHSASGDIWVTRANGNTDTATANGDIRVGDVDGTVVAKTANGNISFGEVTGDLRANTANGDIAVDSALAGVVAKSASGKVRVGEVVRDSVVLVTASGQLELGIREGTSAWLDLKSHYGIIRNSLDTAEGPEQSEEVVKVHCRTGGGDIVIRRA